MKLLLRLEIYFYVETKNNAFTKQQNRKTNGTKYRVAFSPFCIELSFLF